MNLTPDEKARVLTRMYVDPFLFAEVLFGDVNQPMHYHLRKKSPPFHRQIFEKLLSLDEGDKLCVVAPRGHAKTTLISLIYPLHRILFGEEHFVLLISESETQSKYLLEALGNEIEYNEKLKYFFGNRIGSIWGKEEKEVIGRLDENGKAELTCKILIRGTGQKVRGLKYGAYRPTLTIIDDGEGESNTMTDTARDKFRKWLNGAVIPGSADAKLCFVGTIVDEDSYLNRVAGPKAYDRKGRKKVKGWKSMFYQAVRQKTPPGQYVASGKEIVGKDGVPEVLWKEHRPYKWLDDEKERLISEGDAAYFFQEYQNIPMDDSFRVFKKEHIQYYQGYHVMEGSVHYLVRSEKGSKERIPIHLFMGVDPASSENVKADYTAIVVIGVDKDFNIYIIDLYRGQVTPMDGADKIFEMADQYMPKEIKIEETGHVMLADYVMRKGKETGRFLNITPKKAIKAKYYRIKQMQPYFASKAVFMKDEHYILEQELLSFKEHGTFKKDTLDALRWAIDDIFAPKGDIDEEGNWVFPSTMIGADWETGEPIYKA